MMRIETRICAAACLLALLSLAVPGTAATMITGPTVISEPGVYHLANDIINSDAFICIDVRTAGVIIDGHGHQIDGMGSPGSIGIRLQWLSNGVPDTVIRNCLVTDWGSGMVLYKSMNPEIRQCTFMGNSIGAEAYCTDGAEVSSCRFIGNDDGISWSGASNSIIAGNSFLENVNGITIGEELYCYGITISSNEIDGSTNAGIQLDSTAGPIRVEANRVTNSGVVGLILDDTPGHVITNNLFNNRQNAVVTAPVASAWNLDPVHGKNIVGGHRLGGNYWASPDGTGFSQVSADRNRDGFCDAPYTIADLNVDRYPLRAK